MALPGIKYLPVAMPGVNDQRVASKVKYPTRSTVLDVPTKSKKEDQPKGRLIDLDLARLSPGPKGNERRAMSLVESDMQKNHPPRSREKVSAVSTRKVRRSDVYDQETKRIPKINKKNSDNDFGS
jgi:hypothetical protein